MPQACLGSCSNVHFHFRQKPIISDSGRGSAASIQLRSTCCVQFPKQQGLAWILPAHSGRQDTSSGGAGMFSGKQSQRGSFMRSQAKIVGSSRYMRPLMELRLLVITSIWSLQERTLGSALPHDVCAAGAASCQQLPGGRLRCEYCRCRLTQQGMELHSPERPAAQHQLVQGMHRPAAASSMLQLAAKTGARQGLKHS